MSRPPYGPTLDEGSSRPVCEVQGSGAIELYFYDELTAADRGEVSAHLRVCRECRVALEEIGMIRDALATHPDVASPPGGDWTPFMARLEAAVHVADHARAAIPPFASARVFARPIMWLAAAAMLTLVTAGVLSVIRDPLSVTDAPSSVAKVEVLRPGPDQGGSAASPTADSAATTGFAAVSGEHFERSKLVILGLAAKDAEKASASDWAYERQLASALLDDTRIYKQAAAERGLESLAGVMSDLELVLLQTSLSDMRDTATLDRLQRLIRRRDLVTKMDVVEGF